MKEMKRVLSFVLCLVMLVSLIPGTALEAFAAEGTQPTAVVIAGSDFQNSGGDAAGGATVTSIMNQMGYSSVNGVLFGGDYSYSMSNSSNLTNLDGYLDDYCTTAANRIYIQGNHDTYLSPSDSTNLLAETGNKDTDDYGVYVINYNDYSSASSDLKTYLDDKTGYTKPIFVLSHQPLHVTSRGDNTKAVDLFNVLNAYANLNIIFLFGHNHSGGYDAYLGNGSIYLPKGSDITVAGGSTSTLNFTYMNYGYVGYVSGSACTHLTMTAFEIYKDEVIIKRYGTDGQHLLKEKGATVSGYNTDANEYGYAVLNLSTGKSATYDLSADSGDDNSGSGDNSGTTSSSWTYELVTSIEAGEKYVIVGNGDAVALMDNNGSFGSQTVTISGTTLTSNVALTEWTISGTSAGTIVSDQENGLSYSDSSFNLTGAADNTFDIAAGNSNNFSIHTVRANSSYNSYYFNYDGSGWTSKPTSIAYVRLYKLTGTGSGGGSTVTPEGGDWVTISSGVGGTIYTLDEDGLNVGSNEKYLIVDTSANGTGNVLTNSNGDAANTQLTITDKVIVVSDDSNVAWTPTGSATSANFANGSYNIYLSYSDGFLYTSTRTLVVAHVGNGAYTLKRNSSTSGYYVQYSSSNGWGDLSTTSNSVYLFRKTGTQPAGTAEYAKLDGELIYTVARGLDRTVALAKVMEGIDVVVSGDKTAETTLVDSNTDITWTLASNYNGQVPGEYAVTISYKGVQLGVAKVIVPEATILGYSLESYEGSVHKGASQTAETGAYILVNVKDDEGEDYRVPVTVGMLEGDFTTSVMGTYEGLTVKYNGQTWNNFTLTVNPKAGNKYPTYPDPGAVKVNKTATGIDFQASGTATVELSASGIPMNEGVDVLLVLDASSSMEGNHAPTFEITDENGNKKTVDRMDLLRDAVNNLIGQFKTKREDGSDPDIDIAIITFNGNTIKQNTNVIGSAGSRSSTYGIKTGDGSIAGAWEDINMISATWATDDSNAKTPASSGTNYDYGLQMAYDVLAQKQANNTTERQQFVLFLSDGAPSQYNGVESNDGVENYLMWLRANYDETDTSTSNNIPSSVTTNKSFYVGFNNNQGQPHHTAEAIKAAVGEPAKVVRFVGTDSTGTLEEAEGLGATVYSIGLLLKEVTSGGSITRTVDDQETVLKTIASTNPQTGEKRFTSIKTVEGLGDTFTKFGNDVLLAATNARFVDEMGEMYDLQLAPIEYLPTGETEGEETISPVLEVRSYEIWTRQELVNADGTLSEENAKKVGTRKTNADGTYIYETLETITITSAEQATSDQLVDTNIIKDGVICGKYVFYNTNKKTTDSDNTKMIDVDGDGTAETSLAAECFYWNIGDIKNTELALRYNVYLTNALGENGGREAGSYDTNGDAILYYDNYQELPCEKAALTPTLAWKGALVNYAFYLVDASSGKPVNNDGVEVPFSNRTVIVNPTFYDTVNLNTSEAFESLNIVAKSVLPQGYWLYDETAVYNVSVKGNGTGSWTITGDGTLKNPKSTYVTDYNGDEYINENSDSESHPDHDYTHTTVWFAVKWEPRTVEDIVVVDYGLPVDIHPLTNDMFGKYGKLVGIAKDDLTANADKTNNTAVNASQVNGNFGTAVMNVPTSGATEENSLIRYTLNNMQMNAADVFTYAVQYANPIVDQNDGFYYGKVTVIPATTIYYEDSFLTFTNSNGSTGILEKPEDGTMTPGQWYVEGETIDATQDEDRPDDVDFAFDTIIDANNAYGFDTAYENMSQYSMGSAAMIHVNAETYGKASFTFYGTGFDIVSLTSNTTGIIAVKVCDKDGNTVRTKIVDTYYGYTCNDNGDWVVTADTANAIYQVPVLEVAGLDYAKYTVELTATYFEMLDKTTDGGYDLYLDAVRIYDPANDGADSKVIEDAYKADGEGWPSYIELRNSLLDANTFGTSVGNAKIEGMVFIDGDASVGDAQITDYMNFGPNNEVYLAKDQRVAFKLAAPNNIAKIMLGIKSANGQDVTYTIKNINASGNIYGEKSATVSTTTDMYYDMTGWKNDIVVIENTSDSILSITNIKSTYISAPTTETSGVKPQSQSDEQRFETYIYMTAEAADVVVNALKPQPVNPFADVQKGEFFYESVLWAVKNGITNGVDATHFGPYLNSNRAQVVTFLWRAAGSPAPESRNNPFADVPENSWYTDAVLWAVENGITNGVDAAHFAPYQNCNRAQAVTFLWRANGSKQVDVANPFTDVCAGTFYHDAVLWALANGITNGVTATEFAPDDICIRAHVVTFLYRTEHLPELEVSSKS